MEANRTAGFETNLALCTKTKCLVHHVNNKICFLGSAFSADVSLAGRRANCALSLRAPIDEQAVPSLRSTTTAPSHSASAQTPTTTASLLPTPIHTNPPQQTVKQGSPHNSFPAPALIQPAQHQPRSTRFFYVCPNSIRASLNASPLRRYKIFILFFGGDRNSNLQVSSKVLRLTRYSHEQVSSIVPPPSLRAERSNLPATFLLKEPQRLSASLGIQPGRGSPASLYRR